MKLAQLKQKISAAWSKNDASVLKHRLNLLAFSARRFWKEFTSVKKTVLALLTLFVVIGCSPGRTSDSTFEITRVTQEGDGSVNSWVLEGEEGVVLIDAQRSLSLGRRAAEIITTTGKPLLAILLTHPHPDHFGGLAAVLDAFPGTPVYASEATTQIMKTDANGFIAATKQVLGDDSPDQQPLPTEVITDGEVLRFGDIVLVVDEIGQGEADAMSLFYAPAENALFAADVVDNKRTPFFLEGHTAEWLAQLPRLIEAYGERSPVIYPGHGEASGMDLFGAQIEYIETFRALIEARLDGGLTEAETGEIVAEMNERYPAYPRVAAIPNLVRANVIAVADEMASE